MVDLQFLKGGFCSAEECKFRSARSCEPKNSTNHAFLFFSHNRKYCETTVIEHLVVTVLLDSLNLTAPLAA